MSDAANLASPDSSAASNVTPGHTPSPTSSRPPQLQSRPSSSRVPPITPAPLSATITPKVPLVTASSPTGSYAHPSPMGGGPTSASYVVPPRPKPGRKPATDEPASKRKAQNRESQRAFRARKAQKLTEMQAQVENTEQKHKRQMNEKVAEIATLNARNKELEEKFAQSEQTMDRYRQERDYWKEQAMLKSADYETLQQQQSNNQWAEKQAGYFPPMPESRQDSPTRQSLGTVPQLFPTIDYSTPKTVDLGCGNCKANGECACMEEIAKLSNPNVFMASVNVGYIPPRTVTSPMKGIQAIIPGTDASVYAEREIDFTAQFSSRRNRLDGRASIAFMTEQNEAGSSCGFCTDDSNCLCRDESLNGPQSSHTASESIVILAQARDSIIHTETKPAVSDCAAAGPGTCSDCMTNPRQKAWCQRIAQLKGSAKSDLPTPSASRHSSISSPLEPIEPRNDYHAVAESHLSGRHSIGCSEAYKLFEGRVHMDQDKMDWSSLKPAPAVRRDTLPPLRKYSALELDTAGVIATLQQSMAPLAPRDSDGSNADLVRFAQEKQRSSGSPPVSDDSEEPLPAVSKIVEAVSNDSWR
ncbi:hypothetical protein BDV96DRAFT_647928 [Lophiotrema nucula]|uniref:BZIP domain-containing protein n=1 Tax=Lophiotrema nucula TaxID=690887 RepID=A0A6A5Z459_9PLEO|nr:hypothetical protein BDV96DRAFT_647928 [Lophiotrema nucula]